MKSKSKNIKKTETEKSLSFNDIFFYISRGITFPFYLIYLLLFKVPDVPSYFVGFLRFSFFVFAGINDNIFSNWIKHTFENFGISNTYSSIVLGIYAIIMIINVFLSFMEIFGFHDATNSGVGFYERKNDKNKNSNFDAFNEVLEYRDSLLRAKHTPGKIEELKKTGFITRERIASLSYSEEVSEALELSNSQMRALHTPDKYKMLKNLFGH